MPILRVGASKTPTSMRTVAGFSLLEAILVTVVIGLMAALVTPAFTSSYRGAVLKSTVRSTSANLRYARASAIGTGRKKVLALNLQTKRISVLSSPSDSLGQPANSREQSIPSYIGIHALKTGSPNLDLAYSENSSRDMLFEFSPSGSSNGGKLIFAYKNQRYLLEVNPLTGKVEVSVPLDTELSATSLMGEQ